MALVGWAGALLLILILMRMSAQQDRAARHAQKRLDPFCDVTITSIDEPPRKCGSRTPVSDSADRQRPR